MTKTLDVRAERMPGGGYDYIGHTEYLMTSGSELQQDLKSKTEKLTVCLERLEIYHYFFFVSLTD
jgi:hypothetical protein